MGAPGIGKSAFAAHLAHEYGRGTVIAVQFCDWRKPDHRDAPWRVCSRHHDRAKHTSLSSTEAKDLDDVDLRMFPQICASQPGLTH